MIFSSIPAKQARSYHRLFSTIGAMPPGSAPGGEGLDVRRRRWLRELLLLFVNLQ
jgi:hypothetical protein